MSGLSEPWGILLCEWRLPEGSCGLSWGVPSLHFSPRGEAKCVRGPSGLGASRAEEKGASRLACAGVLEQYVEHGKQAQRKPPLSDGCTACLGFGVTKHETRITKHGFFSRASTVGW